MSGDMWRCGSSMKPHVIDEINGYGVCRNCWLKFKDGVQVSDMITEDLSQDKGFTESPKLPPNKSI
jgi:hypothetical protein